MKYGIQRGLSVGLCPACNRAILIDVRCRLSVSLYLDLTLRNY